MTRWRSLVVLLALVIPFAAEAQEWPSRPIRFIVPFPAGGSTDVAARVIGEHLSRMLGQQIVVENKSGASGIVGTEAAAKSAPDGYTILIATDQVSTWQHLFKLNFDPIKDLVPVVQLSHQPVVLAVHPSLGPTTVAELIALAKQRPGMSYATSGVGSQQHIAAQWFAQIAGIKLDHVPYRGGGQAINDLVAGPREDRFAGFIPAYSALQGGHLALAGANGAGALSEPADVPTYQEAGIRGLVIDQWLGVFVPTGTPPAIAARVNTLINKSLTDATIRNSFLQSAQEPVGGTAEEFSRLVHEDFEKYGGLVRDLDIKAN